ncbi:MAG: hypothetical protein M1815_000112 [Lichina confinis]|nr:MAG: hypothetical protein M1815_000112 [Lichina confinis]
MKMLDPDRFLEEVVAVHRDISQRMPFERGMQSIVNVLRRYRTAVARLRSIKIKMGLPFDLNDYSWLLKAAKTTGRFREAVAIWTDMEKNRIRPDTSCLNHFLEAELWARLIRPIHRRRARVEKYWEERDVSRRAREGLSDLKEQAIEKYNEMGEDGIKPDTKTFSLLIIAFARQQDLAAVNWVLKDTWGIDASLILETPGQQPEPETELSKDSSMRPGTDLLFAVAHAFCINNHVPVALRLVDFIAKRYQIPVPDVVWHEILGHTYLGVALASDRGPGHDVGGLPRSALYNLFDIMSSEPYNVNPTLTLSSYLMSSSNQHVHYKYAVSRLQQGIRHYRHSERVFDRARRKAQLIEELRARNVPLHVPGLSLTAARRELEMARLRKARDLHLVSQMVRQLLHRVQAPSNDSNLRNKWTRLSQQWERIRLPDLVAKFREFLPNRVDYRTHLGTIRLIDQADTSSSECYQEYDLVTTASFKAGGVRRRGAHDDHGRLRQGLFVDGELFAARELLTKLRLARSVRDDPQLMEPVEFVDPMEPVEPVKSVEPVGPVEAAEPMDREYEPFFAPSKAKDVSQVPDQWRDRTIGL